MKKVIGFLQIVIVTMFVCLATVYGGYDSNAANSISGQIYDPNRNPVANIYVELQSEYYSTLGRVQTGASGHFRFTGLNTGRFNLKVLTNGTNFMEHSEKVELISIVSGASDQAYLDIYLRFDKRKINVGLGINEAIFVQNIPQEALQLYKKGVKNLDEKGLAEIEQALKIFPDYYDALNTLGTEYVKRTEYEKALPYLIKAITVNQKSFSGFYSLAYACYQLNHKTEAVEAARGATILQPSSINARLLYGTVLRLNGDYQRAETALLEAKKLSKTEPVAEIHWQLALLYNRLGRNKEAANELETYLKVVPDAGSKKEIKDLIEKLKVKDK